MIHAQLLYLSVYVVKWTVCGSCSRLFRRQGRNAPLDFVPRVPLVGVLRFRPDHVDQMQSLFFHRLGHDVGRLLLRIDFAAE